MTVIGRWLPAITQTPIIRKGALGLAGLAFVGSAVAGPAAGAATAPTGKPITAAVQTDGAAAKSVDVRYEAQPNFYYCGPAATRIALTGLGHTPSQDDVAKQLDTTTEGTDSAEDTTRVLNAATGGDTYRTTAIPGGEASPQDDDRLRADVVRAIDSGRPVVANIAGTATDTVGNVHSFPGGHYLTVVGYDDGGQTVDIADPANVNGQNHYSMNTPDLADWIATRGYSA